jgi:hypothetical protein
MCLMMRCRSGAAWSPLVADGNTLGQIRNESFTAAGTRCVPRITQFSLLIYHHDCALGEVIFARAAVDYKSVTLRLEHSPISNIEV